jgi:hypothetical protein
MDRLVRLFAPLLLAASVSIIAPSSSFAGVYISVAVAPPILPVYELPPVPGPNYIWTPGYWAYADYDEDYYWVPGTWVVAPRVGLLWTPGYWGWSEGYYRWNAGYWGPHIGYYGGINYGHGYFCSGYEGGHWDHGAFFYNTAVVHVNTTVIHNTYNKTIINNTTITNVSYNGGKGGTTAKASAQEIAASREHHEPATSLQVNHEHTASKDPSLFSKSNHGTPKLAAVSTPQKFQQKQGTKFTGLGTQGKPLVQTTQKQAPLATGSTGQLNHGIDQKTLKQGNPKLAGFKQAGVHPHAAKAGGPHPGAHQQKGKPEQHG